MDEHPPDEFTFAEPASQPPWEQQALFSEVPDRCTGRAGTFKSGEYGPQRVLDLAIWILDDLPLRVIDHSDG